MKIAYTIDGQSFPTQSDLIKYIQAILRSYIPPAQLKPGDNTFISDLLLRHPAAERKIGCGIRSIWVCPNIPYGHGFYVERNDGTFADFSYRQCIRPFTNAQRAKYAFRRAIEQQVIAIKQAAFTDPQGYIICPVSGEYITWENAHVDHHPPLTFAALLTRYCLERRIDLETIELYEPRHGIGKILPPDIENDWAEWHREHAILRVISAEANAWVHL